MISKAIIIHDSYTTPQIGWYLWAQTELPKRSITTFAPNLPTPMGQSYISWRVMFEPYIQHLGPDTILIGHGTGVLFALRLISELSTKIGGVIAVAPYVQDLPNIGMASVNKTFLSPEINWQLVHEHCSAYVTIAANRDPFVPLELSKHASELMGGAMITIDHEGHILGEKGELPEIIKAIEIINTPQPSQQDVQLAALSSELSKTGVDINVGVIKEQLNDSQYEIVQEEQKVRSFYDDMTTQITAGDAGSMATLLAEERAKEEEKSAKKTRSVLNVIYLSLGIVMVAVGISFYMKSRVQTAVPLDSLRDPSALRAESTLAIKLPDEKVGAIQTLESAREKATAKTDTIAIITPTDTSQRPIGFQAFMDLIGAQIPTDLRTTAQNYIYGFLTMDRKYPFLLVQVDSFDRGFAGVRSWESTMGIDLYRTMISSDRGYTRESLENATFSDAEVGNRKIRQLVLGRTQAVTQTVAVEEKRSALDFPTTITYGIAMGGTFYSDRITWTTLPESLAAMKKGDILIVPAVSPQLPKAYVIDEILTDNVDPKKPMVSVAIHNASPIELFGIRNARADYRQVTEGDSVLFVKTTNETKTELVPIDPEVALITTFLNDKILVITTSPVVVDEISRRLTTSNLFK